MGAQSLGAQRETYTESGRTGHLRKPFLNVNQASLLLSLLPRQGGFWSTSGCAGSLERTKQALRIQLIHPRGWTQTSFDGFPLAPLPSLFTWRWRKEITGVPTPSMLSSWIHLLSHFSSLGLGSRVSLPTSQRCWEDSEILPRLLCSQGWRNLLASFITGDRVIISLSQTTHGTGKRPIMASPYSAIDLCQQRVLVALSLNREEWPQVIAEEKGLK